MFFWCLKQLSPLIRLQVGERVTGYIVRKTSCSKENLQDFDKRSLYCGSCLLVFWSLFLNWEDSTRCRSIKNENKLQKWSCWFLKICWFYVRWIYVCLQWNVTKSYFFTWGFIRCCHMVPLTYWNLYPRKKFKIFTNENIFCLNISWKI